MSILIKGKKCRCGSDMVFAGQGIYSCSCELCSNYYNSKTDEFVDFEEAMSYIGKIEDVVNEALKIKNKYFNKGEM